MSKKLNIAEPLAIAPWPTWQTFVMNFKAQFKPLSREKRSCEQIREAESNKKC